MNENDIQSTAAAKIELIRLGLVLVGGACLAAGAWMAYPPAGWMVGGGLMLSVGLIGALRT